MTNCPNYTVEISGRIGEVFVSDDHGGKYMCVFVQTDKTDFVAVYEAYGFMVWTQAVTNAQTEYFPIKLREHTKLTIVVMGEMWEQINRQISAVKSE